MRETTQAQTQTQAEAESVNTDTGALVLGYNSLVRGCNSKERVR